MIILVLVTPFIPLIFQFSVRQHSSVREPYGIFQGSHSLRIGGLGWGSSLSDRDMVREGEEGHRKKTRLTDQGPKTVEKTALRECFLNRII